MIVSQIIGVSSILAHRSMLLAYWLLYNRLFSDLLYKESNNT